MSKMYAIFDKKMNFYGSPFFTKHQVEMMRSLSQVVKDPNSNLSKFHKDFAVYQIGEFDDNTGKVSTEGFPLKVAEVTDFVEGTLDREFQ